jgi:hypothetical protein
MLTTWALAQPAVLGFTPADGKPLAVISDIATTKPGASIALDASASYDPAQPGATLSYSWSFGDGAHATGAATQHAWASAGDYPLSLTVSDASGSRTITKTIHVTTSPVVITNPYQPYPQDGVPPVNPAVTLPKPDHGPNSGANPSGTPSVIPAPSQAAPPWWLWVVVAALAIIALVAIGFGVSMARRPAAGGGAAGAAQSERQRREQAFRELLTPRTPDQRPPDGGE